MNTVGYSHNGMPLRKNKGWTTDKYNLPDGSHRHNAELQKFNSEKYTQHGPIWVKSKQAKERVDRDYEGHYVT